MLVRSRVGTGPTAVVPPQQVPVNIQVWAMGAGLENPDDLESRIYVALSKEACTVSRGIPLPMEKPVTIFLQAGQSLWAMAPDEGFMGISILGV
jgi:hypothetical protein